MASPTHDLFGEPPAATNSGGKTKRRFAALSTPLESPLLRVLALGLGLQSVVLALKSARGDLPMLDAAIFSDTGDEKHKTYEYLEYLRPLCPFPIIVTARPGLTLGEHAIKIAHHDVTRTSSPPWFTAGPDGMLPKQCNSEYKKRPVQREIARMIRDRTQQFRLPKEPVVEQWFGMTLDELWRMATAEKAYIHNRYPLTEEPHAMKRHHCEKWLMDRQYRVPPKSSCRYCPYQSDQQWLDMQQNHPEDFAEVVQFDREIRPGFYGMEGSAYLHRSRRPIDEIDFRRMPNQSEADFGCGEGYCGS
ncbi:hypothetical protein [Sphingomonas sp. CFBP 13720]|uniref:hypothetical protein n=1 Tax=Sphingomonas sp. CFBP 13720 TaxID=2775302 RepID=UPI00178296B6|nr:hypothetical protein [Sphingomonas sp. CFBP 13720]MBD8677956.1 hypothetical protein [Sphingomonas sp. CFBP 13720]